MSIIHNVTFRAFSKLNLARNEQDLNLKLSDWSLSDWAVAMAGEAGEVCNVVKKLNHCRNGLGDLNGGVTEAELKADLAAEIGDTYTYLDLLAQSAGFAIYEDCILPKFNKVSKRVGSDIVASNKMRLR